MCRRRVQQHAIPDPGKRDLSVKANQIADWAAQPFKARHKGQDDANLGLTVDHQLPAKYRYPKRAQRDKEVVQQFHDILGHYEPLAKTKNSVRQAKIWRRRRLTQ